MNLRKTIDRIKYQVNDDMYCPNAVWRKDYIKAKGKEIMQRLNDLKGIDDFHDFAIEELEKKITKSLKP